MCIRDRKSASPKKRSFRSAPMVGRTASPCTSRTSRTRPSPGSWCRERVIELPLSQRDRSVAGARSAHRERHQLRLDLFAEREVLRAVEIRAVLQLAVDDDVELM